jgi:hypothetical protein
MEHIMLNAAWTIDDVKNGDCAPTDLGSLKPLSMLHEEQVEPVEQFSSTEQPLELSSALQAAYTKMGSEKAFVAWAQKNPNLVYPMIAKLGIANIAKIEPLPTKTLEEISEAELQLLPSNTIKRLLLASIQIKTKPDLDQALGTL